MIQNDAQEDKFQLDSETLNNFVFVAKDAAYNAGKHSLKFFGKPQNVTKKGEVDLVTEVDVACEKIISETLQKAFTSHVILGEESGGNTEADWLWIVDPIDGTTNFTHGYPHYCVSIALAYKKEVVAAVIYEPINDIFYSAHIGRKSTSNNNEISVSTTSELIDSLVITGFYYDAKEEGAVNNLEQFAKAMKATRAIRRDGSAALDLCYVASGKADAFWEHSLQAWDVAAGTLIIKQAGGLVTGTDGAPYDMFSRKYIVTSNGIIHNKLIETIF